MKRYYVRFSARERSAKRVSFGQFFKNPRVTRFISHLDYRQKISTESHYSKVYITNTLPIPKLLMTEGKTNRY